MHVLYGKNLRAFDFLIFEHGILKIPGFIDIGCKSIKTLIALLVQLILTVFFKFRNSQFDVKTRMLADF